MTDLSGAGVRVLLLGTATHPGPLLSPVPAAGRSATALADRLIRRCGVPPGQLRTIVDPPDAHSMAAAVSEEARRAESVLLIYYIGHGLPGPAGELYLAATGTDSLTPGLAAHQALPFSAIREAIGSCRADAVVVVLDCCFSARAGLDGRRPESAFTLPAAHGAYVLAAAQQLALAPEEEEYTTFSGELLRLLDEGDPLGPRRLTLDDVYEHLFRTLRAQGAPLPRRQVADRAGSLVVAANLAYRDVVDAPAEPEADLTDVRCPYLGLSSFGVDDAELFRGRGALIAELFDAVARTLTGTLPLLVVGASGAGKSSLLSAGLLAGLANGVPGLPGTAGWPSIMLTPGERPVEVLATRLDPTGESAAQRLREDPTHAGRLAAALRERHGTERLVVVVDQLEQLFTPALDDLDRRVFLRALAAITGHALVVMALRADFFGHAMAHEELAAALRGNQLLVGPMGLDELQAAIEEPATTVGLRLDDGLADLMLLELGATRRSGADTGALPLLSHALWATWQRRTGARMTVAGYRASGGIAQAAASRKRSRPPPTRRTRHWIRRGRRRCGACCPDWCASTTNSTTRRVRSTSPTYSGAYPIRRPPNVPCTGWPRPGWSRSTAPPPGSVTRRCCASGRCCADGSTRIATGCVPTSSCGWTRWPGGTPSRTSRCCTAAVVWPRSGNGPPAPPGWTSWSR